jgi:hypothetical protein
MPHLMCRTCRVRFHRPIDVSLDAPVGPEACPSCGLALEPVGDLTKLVGFRAEDGAGDRQAVRSAARAMARKHAEAGDGEWGTLRVHAASLPVPEPPR